MLFNVLVAIWQFLLSLLFVLFVLLLLVLHLFLTAAAPHKHDADSDLDFTFSSRIRWFFLQMYKKCMASHWEFYTIAMTSTKYNSCTCIKHRCVQYTFSRMTVTHFDRSKASIYFTYFSFWFFFYMFLSSSWFLLLFRMQNHLSPENEWPFLFLWFSFNLFHIT